EPGCQAAVRPHGRADERGGGLIRGPAERRFDRARLRAFPPAAGKPRFERVARTGSTHDPPDTVRAGCRHWWRSLTLRPGKVGTTSCSVSISTSRRPEANAPRTR